MAGGIVTKAHLNNRLH